MLDELSAAGEVGTPIPSIAGFSVFKVKLGVDRLSMRRGVRVICAVGNGYGWALFIYPRKNRKSIPAKDLRDAVRGLPKDT